VAQKHKYRKLIKHLDRHISLVGNKYFGIEHPDKAKLMEKINTMLEERFRLMGIRDSLQ
jgi:CelD/BcsL family acetyltransferase involved in cellulose biosynthesis